MRVFIMSLICSTRVYSADGGDDGIHSGALVRKATKSLPLLRHDLIIINRRASNRATNRKSGKRNQIIFNLIRYRKLLLPGNLVLILLQSLFMLLRIYRYRHHARIILCI